MSEEKKNNADTVENEKKKRDLLLKKLATGLFASLIITSPITIPYFKHNKIEKWETEENRCWSYINNGLFERAIEYSDTIKDSYKFPSTYLCIGIAYYNVDNLDLALQNFKKAEKTAESITYKVIRTIHSDEDPEKVLKDVYPYITKTLCRMGKHDEAIKVYEKLLDMTAKDDGCRDKYGDAVKEIAETCEEMGDIDNAIRYYQDSLIYYCDGCYLAKIPVYKKLAELYEKKGDKTKAEKYLNKALELEKETDKTIYSNQ